MEIEELKSLSSSFEAHRAYRFSTNLHSEYGEKLATTLDYRNSVAQGLHPTVPRYKTRTHLISVADSSLEIADGLYQNNEKEDGDFAIDVARELIDVASSLTPGISWGRDIYEAMMGKDLIDDHDLDTIERSSAILGAVTLGLGSKFSKGICLFKKLGSKVIFNKKNFQQAVTHAESSIVYVERITTQLSPGKIRNYLSNVDQIPRQTLITDMESIGLRVKGQSRYGRFMEFIDHKGRVRAKIHPPDAVTKEHHLHIYDKTENSVNEVLDRVARKSSEAHIPVQAL